MKAGNILADNMQATWPKISKSALAVGVTKHTQIIGQRVHPNIHDVIVITRHRHTPIKGRARNRQVFQTTFDEGRNFIAAAFGHQKIRIALEMRQQFVFISR